LNLNEIDLSAIMGPTERQREALRASDLYDYLLFGGAGSGGKSYFLRWWCVRQLLKRYAETGIKGLRVGLFSMDYPTLTDRQISRISREFPDWLGKLRDTRSDGYNFALHPEFGGGTIALRNLDDPSKYKSSEFCDIAVEELTENSKETFDDLRFRLRWPGISNPKFAAATNPTGTGHAWVKALWIDHKFPPEMQHIAKQFHYVPALPKDNPHVSKLYEETLRSLPPAKRKALLDGDWSIPEGQYFTNWERSRRAISPVILADVVKPWWSHWLSMDWGFKHYTSIHWHCSGDVLPEDARRMGRDWNVPRKCVFTYRELVLNLSEAQDPDKDVPTGAGELELARLIKQKTKERLDAFWLSPDAFGQKQSANPPAKTISDEFRRLGNMPSPQPALNDRVPGWRFMYKLIQDDAWFVSEMCPEALNAVPMLQYDKDGSNIEDIEKTPYLYDDVGDDLRYGLFSMLSNKAKPHDVMIQEQLASTQDEFARHLIRLNETERRNRASAPRPYWE
jgi:hypothetical protein